jgi:hypothetical protein
LKYVGTIVWIAAVGLASGCSSAAAHSDSASTTTTTNPSTAIKPAEGGGGNGFRVIGASRPIGIGGHAVLVSVKGMGHLTVYCDGQGHPAASFTVAAGGATAMIVFSESGNRQPIGRNVNPGQSLRSPATDSVSTSQDWQITPWTSLGSETLSIKVSALSKSPPGNPGCGAAAQALLVQPT